MPIRTVTDLHEHLELAIQVELSTVPPYLYAMYSIEDQRSEATLLLRSIVAEEMLHAVLASNLLLATGGRPRFDSTAYMPEYPSRMPHHRPPLEVGLAPCTEATIREVFMRIEQPEEHDAPPEPDMYETLGQFYHALENAIVDLSAVGDLFSNAQATAQLSDPSFYAPVEDDAEDSGGLVLVLDTETAIQAIEIIVHQGEGLSDERWADPSHQELTHYYKLLQIAERVSPLGRVRPVPVNPRTADYPTDLQAVSYLFNSAYRYLYLLLAQLFTAQETKTPGGRRALPGDDRGHGAARAVPRQPTPAGWRRGRSDVRGGRSRHRSSPRAASRARGDRLVRGARARAGGCADHLAPARSPGVALRSRRAP